MLTRSNVVISLPFLLALLLQQESCIHPSAQLQTHVQHDVCTHECLSTELPSYKSERQEKQGDARQRNFEICYINTFSSVFAVEDVWQQVVT